MHDGLLEAPPSRCRFSLDPRSADVSQSVTRPREEESILSSRAVATRWSTWLRRSQSPAIGWKVLLAAALLTFSPAQGFTPPCANQFWKGEAPVLLNPKLALKTQQICYSGFALLHTGVTRTALWSAEHLTQERVSAARTMARINSFHPDPNLAPDQRADLSDYARSGFDRGHMAPSGDMPDPKSQEESFSLANMIPQDPDNNRHLWGAIETSVRDLTEREGELYIVTGPVFEGENLKSLNARVLVPTRIYKAIYDPRRNGAAAYVTPNSEGYNWDVVSIARLQEIAGLDPFPALPSDVKSVAMNLPSPLQRPRRNRDESGPTETSSIQPNEFVSNVLKEIDHIGRQ